jgi:hypothetical protein
MNAYMGVETELPKFLILALELNGQLHGLLEISLAVHWKGGVLLYMLCILSVFVWIVGTVYLGKRLPYILEELDAFVFRLEECFTLKMKAVRSSETSENWY